MLLDGLSGFLSDCLSEGSKLIKVLIHEYIFLEVGEKRASEFIPHKSQVNDMVSDSSAAMIFGFIEFKNSERNVLEWEVSVLLVAEPGLVSHGSALHLR